ncbi:acyltransferase family protein [Winogradskyella sp. A3E31]|uniref:acyltransferase family protein n=1 Tax=Winogradskyella sp. A3E31 TaxID=3349637 RepID=UPI00398B56EE
MFNHPNRIFGLDVLRALAITLVVVSHCTYLIPQSDSQLILAIRTFGAIGVDLFFVLSGYLIGGILLKHLERNQTSFKDLFRFWKRRWLRTLPNYMVVLILNCVLLYILEDQIIPGVWEFFLFIQNFSSSHPDFFTEAWSLSIEEYAYLFLPFLIFIALSFFKKTKPKSLFLKVTLITILGLFVLKILFYFKYDINSYKEWSSSFRKVVIYRVDSIYIGFVLIYFVKAYKDYFIKLRYWLLGIGLLLFIALHGFIFENNALPQDYPFFYSIIYLLLLSVSLVLLFPFFTSLSRPKIGQRLVFYISTRSYAIYLVNYSLILLTIQEYFEASFLGIPFYLMATILASECLYQWVEKPFLKFRENHISRL